MASSRIPLVTLTVVALIGAWSCARPEPVPQPGRAPASPTDRPLPTSRAVAADDLAAEDVAADYVAAMEAYFDVARDPDPDHPRIVATRDGPSRRQIVAQLSAFQGSGTKVTYPDGRPTVEVLDVTFDGGGAAMVTSCVVDRGVQVRGGVVVDDDVVSQRSTAVLHHRRARWVVTDQTLVRAWYDGDGCRK